MTAPTTARRSFGVGIAVLGPLAILAASWAIVADNIGEGPVVVELGANRGLHPREILALLALVGGDTMIAVGAWVGRPSR